MNAGKNMLAALAIAGVLASGAYAQGKAEDVTKVAKPFSVKIGGAFFTDSDTKDAIGNSTFTVGLGYDFLKTKATNPIIVQGYVDYFSPKSNKTSVSAQGVTTSIDAKMESTFGIGAAARYSFMSKPTSNFMPYAGVGIGFYSAKSKVEARVDTAANGSTPASSTTTSDSKTKSGVGGKIFLGVEMKQGLFGEIDYNLIPKVEDANFNNFGVRVGYRF